MAVSDDETVEIDCNEERRLCGLAGDDDEDDLREDAAALFGLSSEHPVHVGDEQQVNGQEGEGDEHSAKHCRPSTSAVWLDFEKLFKIVNDKKVRFAAKCIHCSKQYSALSSGGLPRDRHKFRIMSSSNVVFKCSIFTQTNRNF